MRQGVQVVILCEDLLHEVFARAFLYRRGFNRHDLRFVKAPTGHGDAKQCVRERLPIEIEALRRFAGGRAVICLTDADNRTLDERRKTLDDCCHAQGIQPRQHGEPVFFLIPKWEIENWLVYLRDGFCDEELNTYDKYRGRESDIYSLVEKLADMCESQRLEKSPPPSLVAACREYGLFQSWRKQI
jgi:hypothetical protein